MKYRFVFAPTLLALGFLLLTAATGPDKASQILQSSKTALESLEDFKANFQYAISHPNTRTISRSGTVTYKPADKFIIDFSNEAIYCNGTYIWIYEKGEAPTVVIRDFEPEEDWNLEVLFEIYRAKAAARYDGIESVHGVKAHKIYLEIVDPSVDYDKAYLWVNIDNDLPEKVVMIDRKNARTTFEFSQMETNLGMDVTDFNFTTPNGVEIEEIDERY